MYELMLEMKSTLMDLINAYIGLPVKSSFNAVESLREGWNE